MNKKAIASLAALLAGFCIMTSFSMAQTQERSRDIFWSPIPEAPVPFAKAVGGIIGGYFYVFGGQPHTDLALAYSIEDTVWSQSTPSQYRFHEAGYCVANEALYRISGKGSKNIAEKFVPDGTGGGAWSGISSPPQQFRRSGNSCAWDGNDFIYINNCDNSNNPDGYFARYSISGDSWEILPAPPHPRRFAGIAWVFDKLYLIGGLGSNDSDPQICQVFDPADSSWALIAPHPEPLNYAGSTVFSDGAQVWVIGHGGGYGNFPASSSVYKYGTLIDTWVEETELPVARGLSLTAYEFGGARIIQVGGSIGNGMRLVSDGRIGEQSTSEPGMLIGHVIDNWYFNPVDGVEVTVLDITNNPIATDTTDSNGAYSFTLGPGTYSALYTKYSYLDSTIAGVAITSGDTTEVNIILTFDHQCDYYVGDVNGSWGYNGLDLTYGISFFKGGPAPWGCLCECTPGHIWYVCGDVNGDCVYNGYDITRGVYYMKGGPYPIPCPDCPPITITGHTGPE